jgi:hypothetical protein
MTNGFKKLRKCVNISQVWFAKIVIHTWSLFMTGFLQWRHETSQFNYRQPVVSHTSTRFADAGAPRPSAALPQTHVVDSARRCRASTVFGGCRTIA